MTKKDKRKLRQRQREIIYLLLSIILFIVNCLCSFHVVASISEVLTERERINENTQSYGVFNIISQAKTIKLTELIELTDTFEEQTDITIDDFYIENIDIETEMQEESDICIEWRYKLTEYEVELVAAVAMLEDIDAMEAISEVILNRLESDKFAGTTVECIIYAKGQFYVANRVNNITVSEEAVNAALAIFKDGVSVIGDAKFFAEKSVNPNKIARGLYLIDSIGNTNFYGQK